MQATGPSAANHAEQRARRELDRRLVVCRLLLQSRHLRHVAHTRADCTRRRRRLSRAIVVDVVKAIATRDGVMISVCELGDGKRRSRNTEVGDNRRFRLHRRFFSLRSR